MRGILYREMNNKSFKQILMGVFESLILVALIFILILVLKTDIVQRTHIGLLIDVMEKNIAKYTLSINKETNYIYYDYDISDLEKENLEVNLMKLKHLQNIFKENNLKIFVSRNSIDTSEKLLFSNLANFEKNTSNSTSGSYYPNFNLIILDLYDLDTIYNMSKDEELKLKYALELSNELNISTLLHEIGHFLDDVSGNELHTQTLFIDAYDNERDKIFDEDEKYYKSTIKEYIAESTAKTLLINLGLMEGEDAFMNSDTYSILSKYLKQITM